MRRELLLSESMLPLHVQQMIDEVVALLMLGTSQAKGLTHQVAKETIVAVWYYLGSQKARQARKESIQSTGQGQSTIILGHFLVVLGHGKRRRTEATRFDAQHAIEEVVAGEAQAQLMLDHRMWLQLFFCFFQHKILTSMPLCGSVWQAVCSM